MTTTDLNEEVVSVVCQEYQEKGFNIEMSIDLNWICFVFGED